MSLAAGCACEATENAKNRETRSEQEGKLFLDILLGTLSFVQLQGDSEIGGDLQESAAAIELFEVHSRSPG